MNKTRFLTLAVVALVLLNALSLASHWLHKLPRPQHKKARDIIIERLDFDPQQTAAYDRLVEKHRAEICLKDLEISQARQAIYRLLQGEDLSKKDSLTAGLGRLQMQVEEIHFAHFQDIKKLCRTEQLVDFNALTADLERLFDQQKRPKKR